MVLTRHASKIPQRNRENALGPHRNTPRKARVRERYAEFKLHGFSGANTKNQIFRRLDIAKRSGNRILALEANNPSDRTLNNDPDLLETRGRPKKITLDHLDIMDKILQAGDLQDRAMTWETLGYEAGLDVSARTIQRAMGSLNYYKCVACRKTWISPDLAIRRKESAKTMLARYPKSEDWKRVRFSDEVHLSLGPMGKLMIIRRPGERHCANCTQTESPQRGDR